MGTILFQLDRHSLTVLLESVNHRLATWPGGDPKEQEDLMKLKSLLFAALLEFTLNEP